jgi:DNA polymerase-3 subunit delta'
LRFSPLDETELSNAISAAYDTAGLQQPPAEVISACLPLAQGSVGRALRLLERGGSDMHARLLALIAGLPGLNHEAVHALADELTASGSEGSYELFFDIAGETLARIVRHAATGEGAIGPEIALAQRLEGGRALAQWAQLWETVQRAKAEADVLNLDRKNLILGTFFRLEETARQALRSAGT